MEHSIIFDPIAPSEILNIAKKLKPILSSGHDNISTKLIKETIENILHPITHIINQSIYAGIVPKQVIPIHKNSDPSILKHYRPVSLLPVFSKLLEKIYVWQTDDILNK